MHDSTLAKRNSGTALEVSKGKARPPLGWFFACHVCFTIVTGLIGFPFLLWAHVGMLGFWLAVGRGNIWARFFKTLLAGFVLAAIAPPMAGGFAVSMVTFTLLFSTIFSGAAALLVSIWPREARLQIRFRFWEVLVGLAALGCAFALVAEHVEFARIDRETRRRIYFILTSSGCAGLLVAVVGCPILVRKGVWRDRMIFLCGCAALVVPLIDGILCVTLNLERSGFPEKLFLYLANGALAACSLYYLDESFAGAGSSFIETTPEEALPEKYQNFREPGPLDPPADVGKGWG